MMHPTATMQRDILAKPNGPLILAIIWVPFWIWNF